MFLPEGARHTVGLGEHVPHHLPVISFLLGAAKTLAGASATRAINLVCAPRACQANAVLSHIPRRARATSVCRGRRQSGRKESPQTIACRRNGASHQSGIDAGSRSTEATEENPGQAAPVSPRGYSRRGASRCALPGLCRDRRSCRPARRPERRTRRGRARECCRQRLRLRFHRSGFVHARQFARGDFDFRHEPGIGAIAPATARRGVEERQKAKGKSQRSKVRTQKSGVRSQKTEEQMRTQPGISTKFLSLARTSVWRYS